MNNRIIIVIFYIVLVELRFPELPAAEVSILTCTFTLSGYKCLVAALKSLPIRHKLQIIFFGPFGS